MKIKLDDKKLDQNKLTKEYILKHKILDANKVEVLWHPAKRKIWTASKDGGKSYASIVKGLSVIENNNLANGWGFRLDKDKAVTALGGYFSNVVSVLKRRYNVSFKHKYHQSRSTYYSLKHGRDMTQNQAINFGSLEDIQGSTDGRAPMNGGYNAFAIIDEPITKKAVSNPDKIPSKDAWEENQEILIDNVVRYNDDFAAEVGKPIDFEMIYLMNDWGDHPLTLEINEAFPTDDFAEYNFGMPLSEILGNHQQIERCFDDKDWVNSLVDNHLQARYNESNDTLYIRSTKFSKPSNRVGDAREKVLKKIKNALLDSNMNSLAISMGYRHEGENDEMMKAYDIRDFNHGDTTTLKEDGYAPYKMTYSWDIDTRKGACLTLTPGLLMRKAISHIGINGGLYFTYEDRILLDKQIEVPTMGSGEYGELNDLYVDMMIKAMKKHYATLKDKPKRVTLAIDDKRKWFLNETRKKKWPIINGYRTFQQHGEFGILERQDVTKIGFDNKVIYNHPQNKMLEQDIKVCQRADISSPKRKTSGLTNYLDRIDSMENVLVEYWGLIWKSNKNK